MEWKSIAEVRRWKEDLKVLRIEGFFSFVGNLMNCKMVETRIRSESNKSGRKKDKTLREKYETE